MSDVKIIMMGVGMDFSERQQEPGKRFVGFGLVILLHIILVYALLNGLATKVLAVIQKPMETKLVEEVKPPPPPDVPPPPPPKLLAPPPPFVPPPEVVVQAPQAPSVIAATTAAAPTVPFSKTQADVPPVAKSPVGPVSVPAKINFNAEGCTPIYPRSSQRNEEQGTVELDVLVGADGNVADVKVTRSSGFRALDNAVKSQLMSGTCKNKPGTIDGKPQQTWAKVQYVWRLD